MQQEGVLFVNDRPDELTLCENVGELELPPRPVAVADLDVFKLSRQLIQHRVRPELGPGRELALAVLARPQFLRERRLQGAPGASTNRCIQRARGA